MRTGRLSIFFWLIAASTSLPAGTISVEPATTTGTVGQNLTLSINITGAVDLYGYQFDLGFNPAILQATSVTEGPFLATGGPTIFLPGTIDNGGGSVTFNGDILNGAVSGVDGSGVLLDVSFSAISPGTSNVQVFNVFAVDSFGLGLDETAAGSAVSISAAASPEPANWLLFGFGAAALAVFRRWLSLRAGRSGE